MSRRDWVALVRGARDEEGNVWWPERLNEEYLDAQRAVLGPYLYSVLYQNEPIAPEDQRFLAAWIQYADLRYEWDGYPRVLLTKKGVEYPVYVTTVVDPAISTTKYSDFSGITTIAATPDDDWYILSARRVKGGTDKLAEECVKEVQQMRPHKFGIETVAFQLAMKDILLDKFGKFGLITTIEELRPGSRRSKKTRIEALVPRFSEGKVFFKRGLGPELIQELKDWSPRSELAHDDLIDSLSYHLYVSRAARASGEASAPVDVFDLPPSERAKYRERKEFGTDRGRDRITGY